MAFSAPLIIICVLLLHVTKCHNNFAKQIQSLGKYSDINQAQGNATSNRIENLILGVNIRVATRNKNLYICTDDKNKRTSLCLIILMLQNDVEANPGPTKFPCGTCGKAVRYGQKAVSCDHCDAWFHIDCQGMAAGTYEALLGVEFSWLCLTCGLPNLNSSYFASALTCSNTFDLLSQMTPVTHVISPAH